MRKHSRSWIAPAVIVGVALTIRLVHLYFLSGSLAFNNPVIDERDNVQTALHIADGHWFDHGKEFWKPPLYSYALATVFRAAGGPDLWLPRLLQALLDSATCWFTFLLATRLFTRRIALAAAGAVALNGVLVYFTGELVSASLAVFLATLLLLVLIRTGTSPRAWKWLAAGALVGVCAVNRGEMVLMIPIAVLFAAVAVTDSTRARRAAAAALVAAGATVAVAPFALHNYRHGGAIAAVSSNGGINLYIGTEPRFRGMVGVRPGPEWEALVRVPATIGVEGERALSRYYTERSAEVVAEHPGRYAVHVARKLLLFWHGYELASNFDLYRARRVSPVLRALLIRSPILFLPFGLLAPLAVLGFAVHRRDRNTRLVLGFLAVCMTTAVLFFVTSRFRAPALPALTIYAAAGAAWLIQTARARRRRPLLIALAVIPVLVWSNCGAAFRADRAHYDRQLLAEHHHFRGTILYANYDGREAAAAAEFARALAVRPMASTHITFAKALLLLGRYEEAVDALLQAAILTGTDPGERHLEPMVSQLLELISRRQLPELRSRHELLAAYECYLWHDWRCALPALEALATTAPPDSAYAHGVGYVLARALSGAGLDDIRALRYDAARAKLERAVAMRPRDIEPRVGLGLLYHRLGRAGDACAQFAAFRELDQPAGAFFFAARPDTLASQERGGLLINVVLAYLAYFPDDPHAQAVRRAIRTCRPGEVETKNCLYWALQGDDG